MPTTTEHRWNLAQRAAGALLALPDGVLRRFCGECKVDPDGRVLDLPTQALLHAGNRFGLLPGPDVPVARMRRDSLRALRLASPVRRNVRVGNRRIPGPAGSLPVRTYHPLGISGDRPAIVYFHGGGWVVGDLDTHDATCRDLAVQGDCVVVSVDYRLAPEHPFPAAPEDCFAAYLWVREHGRELGIDTARVGVMGDSAGGNLAAVVSLMALERDQPVPTMQGLVYPVTDMHFTFPSHEYFAEGFLLTHEGMVLYRSQYAPDPETWDDPMAAPIKAKDLAGLPPALVLTAGFDPLRDEGRAYADLMAEAGVDVTYRCYDDRIHGFYGMGIFPGCAGIIEEVNRAAGELLRS